MRRAAMVLLSCSLVITAAYSESESRYRYQIPEETGDGLEVGTPDDVGLNMEVLVSAVNDIAAGKHGEVHSLLIYRSGRLVLEEYFYGHDYAWDRQNFHGAWTIWNSVARHNIHSVGKSLASACIGIAIDRGFIGSVYDSIFKYLPAHQHLSDGGKDRITIEHLLTMSSGLEWDEWSSSYSDESNDVIALWFDCEDPVECILAKPLVSEPGSDFNYSGGNSIVLGEIIRNATGMNIEAFADEYLFAPLGIDPPSWPRIGESGVVYAGDQRMTPRDMLKFGVTYLNGGVWNGERILPESWVRSSALPFPGPGNTWFNSFLRPIPPGDGAWGRRGYSYTWWTHEFSHRGTAFPAYWASGWGGQKIVVFPAQDAVVVLTGGAYTSADATTTIVTRYVIPAFF